VGGRGTNIVVMVVTVFLTLLICEFGLRAWRGVALFDFSDFRDPLKVKDTVRYDATLGWTLKDNIDRPDLHTATYGLRRDSKTQTGPRPGNILAVGSSNTQGVELGDMQSWPAQLESLTGRPVDNAGVLGYGLDQMVLRAEQLLPVERPQVLLLGIEAVNIAWNRSKRVSVASKPYFTVEGDALHLQNVPVPASGWQPDLAERIKSVLGHSYLIDRAMAKVDPPGWYRLPTRDDDSGTDPVEVSCRLMRRLQQRLHELDVRGIFVDLPQLPEVVAAKAAPELTMVQECSRQSGFDVVDAFTAMQADYRSDPQRVRAYWHGVHYSAAGNRRLAELVGETLATAQVRGDTH
jgi:lysophospholipase L1-like esterase